jgi:hypothetical protein
MSSTELAGPYIAFILRKIDEADKQYNYGNGWSALDQILLVGSELYKGTNKIIYVEDIKEIQHKIRRKVNKLEDCETEEDKLPYLNQEACNCYKECMRKLSDYLQQVGFFEMVNPNWGAMYDLSKGRRSE